MDSPIFSHTFIELFGLNPDMASDIWDKGIKLEEDFKNAGLTAVLTPHAPYSVSNSLWENFNRYYSEKSSPLSIHHMESEEEDLFMKSHSGQMAQVFTKVGIKKEHFPSGNLSSTKWLSSKLPATKNILLIHNTFSQKHELQELFDEHPDKNFFFGLCPRSNLFIENTLPEIVIKNRQDLSICIGTDSLASNTGLSMWDEVKTLAQAFPELSFRELIEMACINGALALSIDSQCGSFTEGKIPGIVLIEGTDLQTLSITEESKAKRII